MTSGVYAIVNVVNGKRYVGSAMNLTRRWYEHRYDLRRGAHPNRHLQNAWAKYGPDAFRFEVMEECDPEMLIDKEQRFLDRFQPEYNIAKRAGSMLGCTHPHAEATKQKLSALLKGRKAWNKGRPYSPEIRAKMSASHRGKKCRPEVLAKLQAGCKAWREAGGGQGRKCTPETKARLSEASRLHWQQKPMTAEHLAKFQAGHRAWWAAKRAEERGAE